MSLLKLMESKIRTNLEEIRRKIYIDMYFLI